MKTNSNISKLSRKLAMLLILAVITGVAFATLGDGKAKKNNTPGTGTSLLSVKSPTTPGIFSLRSGYNFRGKQVISNRKESPRYITLNTAAIYQRGHTSYIVPLKKKVLLSDKIVFNPNAATRR